jgi:hypothetical protein
VFLFNSKVKEKAYTLWIDNFSKIRKFQIPHIEEGAWRNCLWTGFALRAFNPPVGGREIDMSILREGNEVIPAMPNNPFDFVDSLKQQFQRYGAADMKQLCISNVFKWEVSNVPLKPVKVELVPRRLLAKILADPDKLDNLFPEKIVVENIGENVGFCKIFRAVYEDHEMDVSLDSCKYLALNLDCNIFDRLLKVFLISLFPPNCLSSFVFVSSHYLSTYQHKSHKFLKVILRQIEWRKEVPDCR